MQQERTLVSFDWAIKHLLRNKADYVILEGFLTTLLDKEIKIQNLIDSESNKNLPDDKVNRVDILAEEEDGSLIIIELQFTPQIDYFHRMLFGSSKAIVEHMGKGMPYSKIRKVYSINIVYFDLGSGKDYIYNGTTTFRGMHYKDELELSPEQKAEFAKLEIKNIYPEYYLLKVDRFRDVVKSKLDEWMYYLKNSEVKPDFNALGLSAANERLEYSRLDAESRRAYDRHVDYLRSADSSIHTAELMGEARGIKKGKAEGELIGEARGIEKGKAEGIAEGIEKGKAEGLAEGIEKGKAEGLAEGIEKGKAETILQTAKKMKAEGVSIDIISKITGLHAKELNSL